MSKIEFSKNQTVFLTNTCNHRCKRCIVLDKEIKYNNDYFHESLVELLVGKGVRQVRISGGEPFLEYEKLVNFVGNLKEGNIDFNGIFTNGYIEQSGKTREFTEEILDLGFNPVFNLSIDNIHPKETIGYNLDLIKKLQEAGIKKVVINSSSFTKKYPKNLVLFLDELEKLNGVEKLQDSYLTKKYKYFDLEITVNIKGIYKIDNFEKNILDLGDSFWNFPIVLDKKIKAIGYNNLLYFSEVCAYTGLSMGIELTENNKKLELGKFINEKLFIEMTTKPLGLLFEKIKKTYPNLEKKYFNTGEEFIFWILKNNIKI